MLSSTLEEYQGNYTDRLFKYLESYVDNTERSFLERDLINYTDYCEVLINILDYFKINKNVRLNDTLSKLISKFKKINESTYNEILAVEKNKIVMDKVTLENGFEDQLIRDFIPGKVKIDFEKLGNRITSAKRILDFINSKYSDSQTPNVPEIKKGDLIEENKIPPVKLENPYPQIFSSPLAFKLFEKLHESYKTTKKQTADYSFIYRAMYDDCYILDSCKNTMFINWLSKNYNIVPVKIKTKDNCSTDSKVQNYNTVKELLQIK